MIIHKFPSGPFQTNGILFGCRETRRAGVIDPSPGSAEPILRMAEKEGLSIEQIFLTHSHWDHIADVYPLKKRSGAKVFVHALDAENLRNPGKDGIPLFISITGVEPDGFFEEGNVLEVGNLRLEVIHTPGHSPGSVCFFLREERILFSGDTLFKGTIGNLHLPTGEPEKMGKSLRKLAALPPETRVIPGHGGDTAIGKEDWLKNAEEE